nr:hypothetical protein [Microbacterium bovistercoris]
MLWQERMQAAGGVASSADLFGYGLTESLIRVFVGYGRLERVRRGRFVLRGTDARIREAWRCGGRVACITALRLHGETVHDDGLLHIEVPANAVLRIPEDVRRTLRVHWARRPSPGSAALVTPDAARRQALACHPW